MWSEYFRLVGLKPGKVVLKGNQTVDFSDPDLDIELCKKLYEEDFPYLKISAKGLEHFYEVKPPQKKKKKYTKTRKQNTATDL